jgi:hypothetical protein
MKPVKDRYASAKSTRSDGPAQIQDAALRVAGYEAGRALPWVLLLTILLGLLALPVSLVAVLTLVNHGWPGVFTAGIALTLAYLVWELWRLHVELFRLKQHASVINLTEVMFRIRNLFAGVAVLLGICVSMQFAMAWLRERT